MMRAPGTRALWRVPCAGHAPRGNATNGRRYSGSREAGSTSSGRTDRIAPRIPTLRRCVIPADIGWSISESGVSPYYGTLISSPYPAMTAERPRAESVGTEPSGTGRGSQPRKVAPSTGRIAGFENARERGRKSVYESGIVHGQVAFCEPVRNRYPIRPVSGGQSRNPQLESRTDARAGRPDRGLAPRGLVWGARGRS